MFRREAARVRAALRRAPGRRSRGASATVGLDIGSGYCKAAVVERSGGVPRLARIAVAPNPAGAATAGGGSVNSDALATAVASLVKRERIEPREVVIGLGGRDVVTKRIEVDRMPLDEARAVLPWEAEQHVPFDMEQVRLDFFVVDPEGGGPRMTVLLAAAKLELIESRISLLRQAGLRPAGIDVEAFALHNAFLTNYPDAMTGVTAVVDIGHAVTTIHVQEDGVPVLARDSRLGTGGSLPGSPSADDLADRAGQIADGIQRAARLVETEDRGLGISRVYLCGGGAGVPQLSEAIAEHLGVETHIANAVERLAAGPDVVDDPELDQVSPMLMLATGLALHPVEGQPPESGARTRS